MTTTGSSTITVSFSSSVSSTGTEILAQEYQSSTGTSTTWSLDVAGNAGTTVSSTVINLPTLTPSGSHELYVDYTGVDNNAVAGSTSGVTYDVTTGTNLFAYDPNVSASLSPTASQTPSSTYSEVAALLTATISSGSSVTDSTWDVVSGGSVPLNVNDATTSSGTTTNTSYLYGDLLLGGIAPIEQITTTSSGSTVRYLVANQTGVQGVYSSSGAVQELALYSLYGVQTITSGTKVTPFGYQGSYTDATGLIYLVNRYYDPTTDEFLSIDPDFVTTDQPYVFTGDNPLNSEDPEGLEPVAAGGNTNADTLAAAEALASIRATMRLLLKPLQRLKLRLRRHQPRPQKRLLLLPRLHRQPPWPTPRTLNRIQTKLFLIRHSTHSHRRSLRVQFQRQTRHLTLRERPRRHRVGRPQLNRARITTVRLRSVQYLVQSDGPW